MPGGLSGMPVAERFHAAIREMTMADYDDVTGLLARTGAVTFRGADSRAATERYLQRNPELSFVAHDGPRLIGCVMSGHDGRRGYLQHLVVVPGYRQRGVATRLVEHCLGRLEALGIMKTHIDVLKGNEAGLRFWAARGWQFRDDISRLSFVRGGDGDA